MQVAPFTPHACFAVPALHVPSFAQQPAQFAGSHTHVPFMQIWPAPHAEPVPHAQVPLLRQPFAFV